MSRYLHKLGALWPCRIRKTDKAQDLILRDGDGAGTGYSIWAYDDQLNLRWRQDAHESWYGMYMWFYDVDGDGVPELAVGATYDDDGGTNRGAVYILFLNADGTVRAQQKISSTQGGLGAVLDNSDLFGHSVASLGDFGACFFWKLWRSYG